MRRTLLVSACLLSALAAYASAQSVSFSQSSRTVAVYNFVEVTLAVSGQTAANPFVDVTVEGSFQRQGAEPVNVGGFCDSLDGSVYRIRFMPARPGLHSYTVRYSDGSQERSHQGAFEAQPAGKKGLLRVDPAYPWHFVWEGSGDHFFWNGTTTYWLVGWDDATIRSSIDRLAALKVNRLRVALMGRVKDAGTWYEQVFPTANFSFFLEPWIARQPSSVEDPRFDVTRFNVGFWRKFERALEYARDRDIVVSVIFYVDGARPGADPFGGTGSGGADEVRYYRYAAARFAAFSNVAWDLANEYRAFRNDAWAEKMGRLLKEFDPYDHLISTHGFTDFRFRTAPWADYAMYQSWDECGGYQFMLNNRLIQSGTGRKIPQVNEEYGYEDHYSPWDNCGPRRRPDRAADTRRRLAWQMYMAGGYQTTGERADTGTGAGPDTGGGWVNGRGDDSMQMLKGYAHIADFFSLFEWWKTEPHDELVDVWKKYCLAEPGKTYAVYLMEGGRAKLRLEPGTYTALWFDPRTGKRQSIGLARGPEWTSPASPGEGDWALLLRRVED